MKVGDRYVRKQGAAPKAVIEIVSVGQDGTWLQHRLVKTWQGRDVEGPVKSARLPQFLERWEVEGGS